MKGKKRRPLQAAKLKCDKWRGGYCMAWAETYKDLLVCPRARARHAGPGECCHHPLFETRSRLSEMKNAGVDIAKWGKRLRDPAFVEKLYRAFRRKRSSSSSS